MLIIEPTATLALSSGNIYLRQTNFKFRINTFQQHVLTLFKTFKEKRQVC